MFDLLQRYSVIDMSCFNNRHCNIIIKIIIEPVVKMLYEGQNEHRKNISFNIIDAFNCCQKLTIV